MNHRCPTIFLSAAEASGDLHAAGLIRSLRERLGDVRFIGVAGEKMAAAGCEVIADLTMKASMVTGPFLHLGYYVHKVRRLGKAIVGIRPDIFVPVDSPALNWHLSAAAKKVGSAVVHYVCPQVWAWGPWRIKRLKRLTDHVACLLPFEVPYLQHRGVPATFVGHPLFDHLQPRPDHMPDLIQAWADGSWSVALLPGSRCGEIRHHGLALLLTARAIRKRWPHATCRFTVSAEEDADTVRKACGWKRGQRDEIEIVVGKTANILACSHFAVAVSGTVTLEVAHYGVPMVIFYKVGKLNWDAVGRWLVRTPYLSLVNILSRRAIVPELMPWHGRPQRIRDMTLEVMHDLGYLLEARRRLLEMVKPLRAVPPRTAADNTADLIIRLMQRR